MFGTPANRLFASPRPSASTNNSAPMRAKFRSKNCRSQRMLYASVCSTTMEKSTPQAIDTLYLISTITQPPSWPTRLTKTKSVARNTPQPHDIFIYSRCSDHWNHMRSPSSRKVAIRHNLATVGRMCLDFLITCGRINCVL